MREISLFVLSFFFLFACRSPRLTHFDNLYIEIRVLRKEVSFGALMITNYIYSISHKIRKFALRHMKTANGCTRTPTVRQGKGEEEKMEGEFVRL